MEISKIKPYPKNAKKHPKKQIQQVADSIKEFGFNQPIVIDKKGVIIVGHGRFEAAKLLGLSDVPTIQVDLTEEQSKAYRLADNKLNESEWELDLVIDELRGLSETMLDLSGFDIDILNSRIDDIGWNPEKTEEAKQGDGIFEKTGYGLQSFWKDIRNENSELFRYWIELPLQDNKKNLVKQKYSRTNLEEIRRIIKTYMREGDYFLESCCGWSTFSCSAVLHGFNGIGIDIWDKAIEHGKKQYNKIKHLEGIGKYEVKEADAMDLPFEDNTFDFVYCNPPFMDEEKYSGLDNDIAVKDEEEFKNKFIALMSENYRVLKNDNLCIITINDRRAGGVLEPLQAKVIDWGQRAGFKLWDFVVAEVLSQKIRLRKKDYDKRRTVKCHEYVIVFKKM